MKIITLLIPCFNEAQSLPLLYRSIVETIGSQSVMGGGKYELEILFINDGSRDDTLSELMRVCRRFFVAILLGGKLFLW